MSDKDITRSSAAEYLTFVAASGDQSEAIEVRYQDENVWLTQKMMAVLYGVTVQTVGQRLQRISADSVLDDEAAVKNHFITAAAGKKHRNVQDQLLSSIFFDSLDLAHGTVSGEKE